MKRIFIFLAAAFATLSLSAQNPMMQPLPNDPAVKVGKLENGLTYYIRKNALPEHRAEFYLATKAGGIFETPDQDGLAHFLEHMCFNGTERFPGKGILNYLQSIGAEFGRNINASTGFEETQYMLNNIPVERESVADSCLLILSEYAHYVLNEQEELDLERPVIVEERRSRRNAQWRTLEASLPYYFGNTKYATCTLIGSEENLKTFQKSSIDTFYATWYHPGNQAVVVVGDIDPDHIEAKIAEYFGRIPACENPAPEPQIEFPANAEPVVGVITDPELTSSEIEIVWKSEAMPEAYNATIMGEMFGLVKSIVSQTMYERFDDITSKTGAPYIRGSFGFGTLIYDAIDASFASVTLREDNVLDGFRAYYTEIERLRRYGITDAEFNRAKAQIVADNEAAVEKASTRKNPEFIRRILNNFFDSKPFMEPEVEKQIDDALLGQLNANVVNQILGQLFGEDNMVMLFNGAGKEGSVTPTEQQMLDIVAEVKASDVKPLEGEEIASEFMDGSKLKASPVKKTAPGVYGSTVWTLKNGVEVTLLPTEYTKDQIRMSLWREGGRSLIATADLDSFDDNVIGMFYQNCGVAGFTGSQTKKMLTGKNVYVQPYLGSLTSGINATSTKKDLETAFQLIYLTYMQPRFDADEYQVGVDQLKSMLPGIMENPQYKLQRDFYKTAYGNNPRKGVISEKTLENASIATVEKYYKKLFSGTKGLKLIIVGDFNPDEIKPLVEKYIGGIKKGGKQLSWVDTKEEYVPGEVREAVPTKMETPLCTAIILYSTSMEYSPANDAALDALSYILDMRNTTTLREEIGGTYGASSPVDLRDLPTPRAMLQVVFACKPELCDTLVSTAQVIVEDMAKNGPTDEEFNMTLLNLKKNVPENRINNGYWLNLIKDYNMLPVEYDKAYEEAVNKLTAADVQNAARALVESGNIIEFVQKPE
ncbi:MAG: insulinase family protein [Bacteroidales bacterium]|nr:insulinase family protein [Bacteroidales bacterium]